MSRRITTYVRIGGIETQVRDIRTTHDVDQPIGTGSITLSAPVPHHVQPGASVEVYAGWDGAVLPIFMGRIPEIDATFDNNGATAGIKLEGESWRLRPKFYSNRGFIGPQPLDRFVRSLGAERGVPNVWTDTALTPGGDPIELGSNADVDNNWIPLNTNTSPIAEITRISELFGYRYFDTPQGIARWKRISGWPEQDITSDTPVFAEGVTNLSTSRQSTIAGIVNYWEVKGAEYTASDMSEVAIRSIPAVVPFDPRLGPDGVNQATIRDAILVTEALAAAARNAHEIDYSEPQARWRWQTTGRPERQPGEAVAVAGPRVNKPSDGTTVGDIINRLPVPLWLMRVEHSISDAGWTTTMEGWAGAGSELPAGNDCVTQELVGDAGWHLGTETLSHYKRPAPDGLMKYVGFTVAQDYSTLTIRARGHGTNSFEGNTPTEVSRFEIWQTIAGESKKMASGNMPRLNEYLEQRKDYTNDANWEPLVIPLSGSLKAGSAELRIISAFDREVGDYDDFEVANVTLTTCGVGTPDVIQG